MFGYFTTLYRIFRQWRFDRRVEARVRLAVVGSVGVGKTYLLQDIVGSLEKLGLEVVDIYRDQSLHRQTKDIVRVGPSMPAVRRTTMCRTTRASLAKW